MQIRELQNACLAPSQTASAMKTPGKTEKESRGRYTDRMTECQVPWAGASLGQEMAISEKLGAFEQNRDFSWFPTVTNEVRSEHWGVGKGTLSPIFATLL